MEALHDEFDELLEKILADQDLCNSADWLKILMHVIPGSESDSEFKSRIEFASMSCKFSLAKNIICQLMLLRPTTIASEIFPALGMFDKLQECNGENTDCSVKAVAALLERNILKIKKKNEVEVRDVLKNFDIDFSKMMSWW